MQVICYSDKHAEEWNAFVASSRNGTFLFNRGYMDYHKDRFGDSSLMFVEKGRWIGAFPACFNEEKKIVSSHGGLTYGGLILSERTTAADVMQMMELLTEHYRNLGALRLLYKPIPYIYSRYPSDEELYALFRHDAKLVARGLSSAIPLDNPLCMSHSRKDGVRRAKKNDLLIEQSDDVAEFWNVLNDVLYECHGAHPVHTSEELQLLKDRFNDEIRLYIVKQDEKTLGGCVLYLTPKVIHVQYIAASKEGKEKGALDLLFGHLLETFAQKAAYFDFGISTEQGGKELNEGLIFQKEGFGGRGVCYDQYEMTL